MNSESQLPIGNIGIDPTTLIPFFVPTKNIPNYNTTAEKTSPVFTIIKQPKKFYRFRFECEIEKESHGYLMGIDSAGRNLKTYTTVELQMHPQAKDEKYFIRCTLHQPLLKRLNNLAKSFISPHSLCRREKKGVSFTREDKLFPMDKVAPNSFHFKLENFLISCPKKKQTHTKCQDKYKLLHEQNDSKLRLAMPSDKDEIELKKAQIGFEAFKLVQDGSYAHVTGPIFSHCISNGEPLKIKGVFNSYGTINGGDEVALLVTGHISKMEISIEIDDTLGWHESVYVMKDMWHLQAAIVFKTPKYRNSDKQEIKCEIRLKRDDDDYSDVAYFTYVNNLKIPFVDTYQFNETQSEPVVSPQHEILSTRESSFDSENMDHCQTDSEAEFAPESDEVIQEQEPSLSTEAIKKTKILDETLKDICSIYKQTEVVCRDKKLEYSKHVRQCFDYYKQESPYNNSILHDILVDDKYQRYEMKLYKIIQHFELKDLIPNSKNIYRETPLMYACIFKKPKQILSLINMECPIQARDDVEGNNVLHLISQHQSTEECRKSVIEAVKDSHNEVVIAGFVKAMKHTNFNGLTPLHVAVKNDKVKLVAEFLALCKRHNVLNDIISCGKQSDGNTILHQAVLNKSEEMYSGILKYVPDNEILNLQNFAGKTAAEINQNMEKPLINRLVDYMEL